MPSTHPDYEYDIFISYRQNDNQLTQASIGWVTSFVEALRVELEATLKNPVSIYFDENPHDGLLETHQVDASLAKKLKCLVFIPIISQTYCDEHCFAWEHEFIPFLNMAKEDELGMNITLSNGNVVSRVLPIKIHDLDTDDQHILEAVLDGPLRSIDFIYAEPGVNRPLKPNDDRSLNLEKTDYHNQINKVANALKDIGTSILKSSKTTPEGTTENVNTTVKPVANVTSKGGKTRKLMLPLALVAVLILAFFFLKPYLAKETVDKDISEVGLAILPLKNISAGADIDFLSYALKDEIHEALALSKKFAFLSSSQATAVYKDKNLSPQEIGHELGVDYVLAGSYQISGDQLNVRVEFADAETGKSVWTHKFIVKYEAANIFPMQTDIAQKVLAIFNESDQDLTQPKPSINLEAYSHYVKGLEWLNKGANKTKLNAIKEFSQAITLDSTHTQSWLKLIQCKGILLFEDFVADSVYIPEIEAHIRVLSANHPQWAIDLAKGIYQYHALNNYNKGFSYFKSVLEKYPDNEVANLYINFIYKRKLNLKSAYEHIVKAININPKNATYWLHLSTLYRINGDNKHELQALNKALALGLDSTNYASLPRLYQSRLIPFDSIPEKYRNGNNKRFMLNRILFDNNPRTTIDQLRNLELDKNPGPNNYTKTEYYYDLAKTYYAIYLDDSVMYFAGLCIAENEHQKEKEWYWVAYAYSLLGDIDMATKIMSQNFPVDDEDLLESVYAKTVKVRQLVLAKKYTEATKLLLELNKDYPKFGDYDFLTSLPYKRAKKECPPFAEVVANLKLPEPLVKDEQLERLRY
jgi:TolB-like protein